MRKVKILKEWKRSNREIIRVTIGPYKGRCMISVRGWYRDTDGEFQPGHWGINFGVEHLDNIVGALRKAQKRATKLGLMPDV